MTDLQVQFLHAGVYIFWAWFWYPKTNVTNTNNNNVNYGDKGGLALISLGFSALATYFTRLAIAGYFAVQAGSLLWALH